MVLDLNIATASRACSRFARAVEVASNIQKNLGMGRLCSDFIERSCGAELEWLPHEGWVPAGSWASHLPTPVQISESESTLNYQLQQELPNLLTDPISSGGMFQYCSWHCFPITVRATKMEDEVYHFRWERHFNPYLKKELQKLLGFLHWAFKNQTLWVELYKSWVKCIDPLQNDTEVGGPGLSRRKNWFLHWYWSHIL